MPLSEGILQLGHDKGDFSMRHLVTAVLFVVAVLAYSTGLGPLFFGVPLVGSLFVAFGILIELVAWWRVTHTSQKSSTAQ